MVEMSQEQSFQVLGGSASQRNESDHGHIAARTIPVTVFPVVFPDTGPGGEMHPETSHLSLQANSASSEQSVKRKRGRPRKIKPEDHGDDATMPDQQQEASVKRGRPGRPKRSEQTTKQVEPPLGDGEASVPVKKSRGRPRKIATPTESQLQLQQHLTTQPSGSQAVSSDGVASHTSTTIYNTVQQLAQNAAIVSAINIQGTPVQVLPTTAVATMNMIDSNSPLALRPAAPVSVVVSPTRDDATEWTATRRTTPPPRTTNKSVSPERRACGTSLAYQLQGASSPPLLHAEQPKMLNLLPQCSLSSSEVSVKLVDRLAELEESDGHGVVEEVRHDTRYLKQQGELDASETKRKGVQVEDTSESTQVSSSGKPDMKTQGQTTKVKPQPEQALVKRKRGRPPKNRNPAPPSDAPQLSTATQEEPNRKDIDCSMSSGPSVATAVVAAEQPVVKRKPGRPPKVKTQNPPSESPSLPPRATTTATVNGEENRPITPRRGRPPKSTKTKVQTAEASGEVKVKRGRGRPRKYPIPAVAASGPFLPSVSGITLPATGQCEEGTPTQGVAPLPQVKSKQQSGQEESSHDSQATVAMPPVKRKRGRPPKYPDGPPPAKRKPGRPRIHPIPDLSPQRRGRPPKANPEPPLDLSPRKRGRPRRNPTPDLTPQKRGRPPKMNPEPPDLSPRKRGRPRKHPLPGEETVPPRKPGRPRKNPSSDEIEDDSSQNQQNKKQEQQEERKPDIQTEKTSPEVIQKETAPIVVVEVTKESLSKRKRGRPKKIPPIVATLQEPTLSSSADESTASLSLSGPEKTDDKTDDDSSMEVEKLSLQISFSDSDSEHSEKLEVQSSTIMALANRVVAPSPSPPPPPPPRQLDSPLLDPSFEESYDEDSDPEMK